MLLIGCSSLYYRSKGESADILTLMRRADHTDRRCWFSGFRFVPYSPLHFHRGRGFAHVESENC